MLDRLDEFAPVMDESLRLQRSLEAAKASSSPSAEVDVLGGRDELGRVLPGSARGWGVSWWLHEQGVTQDAVQAMTPGERLALLFAYFEASNAGWEPAVARDDWAGPHHFDDPAP